MKLIDSKGKVFGLINIIDLAVILIGILLISGGLKRFKEKPVAINEEKEAILSMNVKDVREATVKQMEVGDPLYHYDKGTYLGEIIELEFGPYFEPVETPNGWLNSEVPNKYSIDFKVKSNVKDTEDVVIAGGEQTRVGIEYRLKNKKIAFFGTVMDIEIK